jgi:hypothetical protein
MTGPEHYAEAERLAEFAESVDWQDGTPDRPNRAEYAQTVLAVAQVHATLAIAAAAAEAAPIDPEYGPLVQYPRAAKALGDWDTGNEGSPWGQVLA